MAVAVLHRLFESTVKTPPPFQDSQFIDRHDNVSMMAYVPPFTAACALSDAAAAFTPSGTVGDWFLPNQNHAGLREGDYQLIKMGNFFVDRYLCSAHDATASQRGTFTDDRAFVSQRGVAPMVDLTIDIFKRKLAARFAGGAFSDGTPAEAGTGGLLPDVYWHQIWLHARLSGTPFHGNTDSGKCFVAPDETGALDGTTSFGTLTGAGPASWQRPLSDFTGNRAEFTDGLRLIDGVIHSAGYAIDPPNDARQAPYRNTGLRIEGVEPYQSVASYRVEPALRLHGIGATDCPPGTGGMSGQGLFHTDEGERIADRGSGWTLREIAPGKLSLGKLPDGFGDRVGARAIWVPR